MSGNQYMMIFFEEDGNYIHVEATTDRTTGSTIQAYSNALALFSKRHGKQKIARLDNETSGKLEAYLSKEHQMELEFVPPGTHRALKAERAIETWKEHFISILAGTDPEFPMQVWDELIVQGEATLNMMRPSNVNPTISAWEHMNGPYNFDRHPLAPAGIKVAVHEKPNERGTWAAHATIGFYLGPAMQHHRCYRVFRVIASKNPLLFLSNPLIYPIIRLCLLLEGTGIVRFATATAKLIVFVTHLQPDLVYTRNLNVEKRNADNML